MPQWHESCQTASGPGTCEKLRGQKLFQNSFLSMQRHRVDVKFPLPLQSKSWRGKWLTPLFLGLCNLLSHTYQLNSGGRSFGMREEMKYWYWQGAPETNSWYWHFSLQLQAITRISHVPFTLQFFYRGRCPPWPSSFVQCPCNWTLRLGSNWFKRGWFLGQKNETQFSENIIGQVAFRVVHVRWVVMQ